MQETFNLFKFVNFFLARWRAIAILAVAAGAAAAAITLVLPAQYTAVSRLIIDPPAGSDARSPQVITPQYLESLRTFESVASSDSLFEQALERFGLRKQSPGRTVEAWKRKTLDVALVRNTKVLEVAVTLPDPRTAHEMAQYLAEETIRASRDFNRAADKDLIHQAENELEHARTAFEDAGKFWGDLARTHPIDGLRTELETLAAQDYSVGRMVLDAQVRAAAPEDAARLKLLLSRQQSVKDAIERTAALLAAREETVRSAEDSRKLALARYDAAQQHLGEVKRNAGYRGERLNLIDPGIVPERPSSPNLVLNVIGAVFFALAVSLVFWTWRFSAQVAGDE